MKTKHYLIGICILILFIFFIFFNDRSDKKICDVHKTNSLILKENPYLIKLLKNKNDLMIEFSLSNIKKQYKASYNLINFYNDINPICSETVYKTKEELFQDSYCFKAEDYFICRGKVLQKGYPIAIKKNQKLLEKMYILNSYPWKNVEEKIEELKDLEKNPENLIFFIDTRIWKLPEKSFIYFVSIQDKENQYQLEKIKNQWYLNKKLISPGIAMKFINQIVMLEEEINLKDTFSKDDLILLYKIHFNLDFDEWKYSLFQTKNYEFNLYKTKTPSNFEKFFLEIEGNLKPLKKSSYEQLQQSLESVINQLTTKNKS